MKLNENPSTLLKQVRSYAWVVASLWTACIAASLVWNLHEEDQKVAQIARISAQTVFENDVLYRHWAADKGGIYVSISGDTPPNSYLTVPERDVLTTSGMALTLMNPAYMTRQVHEMAGKKGGSQGHITSLNPIRPENVADPWEADALRAFETGVKEISSVEQMAGGTSLRLMRPFVVEEACLKCHGTQGYKVGDIRGGISVSVPLGPLQAIEKHRAVNLTLAHVALWLVGLTGIVFSKRSLGKEIVFREQAEATLHSRLRLSEVARHGTLEQLMRSTVNEASQATGSRIGYFRLVDTDQKHFLSEVSSTDTTQNAGQTKGVTISQSDVLLDCLKNRAPVINNDYTTMPGNKGMLVGHVPVEREAAVPVLRDDCVVAILGVSNKPADYTPQDMNLLQVLAYKAMDLVEYIRSKADAEESRRFLENERTLLQAVMDGAKNAHMVYLDCDFNFVRVNETYARTCGYTPEEMVGKNHFALYPNAENEAIFARVRDTGISIEFHDKPFIFPDQPDRGITYWNWTLTAVKENTGKVKGLVFSLVETTERKQAEEALRDQDRRKDEFLALLGHELRNPLAALSTTINLLKKGPSPERRQLGEAIIERQVGQLQRLVDDLLDVSRITRGKIELHKEPVEIGEHIKRTTWALKSSLADQRVSLWLSTPSAPAFVSADPVRLEQIFVNLLGNAAKFTPQGGDIWFSADQANGNVTIRCRDNGIGIEPDKISWIFEPFTQDGVELHRADAGLGIGLALVKNLVEKHGGSVSALSEGHGKGSEFIVTLPVIEPPPSKKESVSVSPAASGTGKRRILIAEDNRDLAQMLRMLLEDAGHEVSVVHDGNSALSGARREHPDVMLIDIGLPGRNGYALAEAVRNTTGLANTLLIGISGYQQDHAKAEGCFDHYIVKPVDTDALLLLLDQAAENASDAGESDKTASRKACRILLIEDHPDLGTTTLEALRDAGYEAFLAQDGESGVETAKTLRPHIVLCDLRLPGMSGIEVAQELRKDKVRRSILLVALTAADVRSCEPEMKRAGFDCAVAKPLQLEMLQELVAKVHHL